MKETIEPAAPPSAAEMIVGALGSLLLPRPTGDLVTDANTILNSNYPLGGKGPARLNVGGLVVKGTAATFSYDYGSFLATAGARHEERAVVTEILEGLGKPVLLGLFTNATQNVENMRATFDPRRTWLNTPGGPILFNALRLRTAVAGDLKLDPDSNEARVVKMLRIKITKKEIKT